VGALHGVAVLVTRPELQSAPLCELLTSAGAQVIRMPALQIKAVDDALPPAPSTGSTGAFDLIIFTSANAVHFGASWLAGAGAVPLAAIGPATARALDQYGLRATVTPSGGFDSEHLLQHPRLEQPRGQRILIVKGRQGRELLHDRLTARGATVVVAEVYERCRVAYSSEQLTALAARFGADGPDIITATSVEVAAALVDIATPLLRNAFGRAHWLVPGARVAQAVRGHGIDAPLIHADSAEDHDLFAAIVRWRSIVSDA
jgi:uroporphyrinogen-III synthase